MGYGFGGGLGVAMLGLEFVAGVVVPRLGTPPKGSMSATTVLSHC